MDGGHDYNTVVNDLSACIEVINSTGTVICDDYNLGSAPGVKKAIDDFLPESCNLRAALKAMFVAKAVFPIAGLPANTIKSDLFIFPLAIDAIACPPIKILLKNLLNQRGE